MKSLWQGAGVEPLQFALANCTAPCYNAFNIIKGDDGDNAGAEAGLREGREWCKRPDEPSGNSLLSCAAERAYASVGGDGSAP